MPKADFSTLEGIYTAWTPSDLVGTVTPNLGGVGATPGTPDVADQTAFGLLLDILQNHGRGVYPATQLKEQLKLVTKKAPNNEATFDSSMFLDFYSTQGFINELGKNVDSSKTYKGPKGDKKQISSFQEIIGKDFPLPNGKTPMDVTLIVSRSPFFSPMTRGTHVSEIFLNTLPNVVASQLMPFLQVEFQLPRSPSDNLQSAGLLKFLMGSPQIKKGATDANNLMITGRQVGVDNSNEYDYAGMEMFTSPQTLVNPQPNLENGTGTSGRYADVSDPFRPFGSIESLTINAVPAGAGFYVYKKATLVIKIHDRGRLAEISDFLRPRVYSGVTIWLTYGWRAPDRPGENPYFDYVNDNMLVREAYHITNCGFTFDQVGQVTLSIELFTKGVNEMRQSKISDNDNDLDKQFRDLQAISEKISEYRQALKLDPQQGLNKELRSYIVLDAAEQGTFPPNLSADKDIKPAIQNLKQTLMKTSGIDKDLVQKLINEMQNYYDGYTKIDPVVGKMTLKDSILTRVTETIQAMFTECMTGPDPFLPSATKEQNIGPHAEELAHEMDNFYNKTPPVTDLKIKNVAVSFGKLFTVFAMRNLISAGTVDELQVFFYPLNESCGPVSGLSVAQFPIDMPMFLDQYREYVIRNGGERITLEDFLAMVINAQFLDPRALGYGMSTAYAPFDPKSPDAKKPDKQGTQDNALDAWGKKYGTFKQPTIEMMIEVAHPRVDVGENDTLLSINTSAASGMSMPQTKQNNAKQIMRIHLYDKQVNPYKVAGKMVADITGGSASKFRQADPVTNIDQTTTFNNYDQQVQAMTKVLNGPGGASSMSYNSKTGAVEMLAATSNQRIKDAVSKSVPTIRFGANGSTIMVANLGSKADPRVTSVNMQRSMTIRNTAAPNGSGEGGIPLRVVPATLNMTTMGNPLAQMAQVYFVDFQTGTTLDNLYIVTGLTHTITPGRFETAWQFGYSDAYGVFEQAVQNAKDLSNIPPPK